MDAVDSYIPTRSADRQAFIMPIEDVFGIKGRGTVATAASSVASSRSATKSRSSVSARPQVVVTGVEMFKKLLDEGRAATTSAACCAASSAMTSSAARSWPVRSVKPHTKFIAACTFSPRGGWPSYPVLQRLPPQFYCARRTSPAPSTAEGAEMIMPGDNVDMTVELITRSPWKSASASPSVRWTHCRRRAITTITE